jgi:HAD superfamily hydrolase (TIGR01509 family)
VQSKRTIRAVIFDMDGVLTDSEPLINAAAVAMFREKGLTVQPEDFIPFVGAGENRYIGGVAEKYGFPVDLTEAKRRTYEIYLSLAPERLAAFPGGVELVKQCRAAGLRVILASSADLIKINANLEKIGLPPNLWDAIVHGEEVEHKKPAPDIFLTAAHRLGLWSSECVVVEDAINGIQAAKAARMRCVAVAQSFPAEQLQLADVVKPAIDQVTLSDLLGEDSSDGLPDTPPVIGRPVQSSSEQTSEPTKPGPWGGWATFGLGLAITVAFIAAQAFAAAATILGMKAAGLEIPSKEMETNGLVLSVARIVSAPVGIGLTWLFAWVRDRAQAWQYLGLRPVSQREVWLWCIRLLVLLALFDGVSTLIKEEIVPDFMIKVYQSATVVPLLWLAVVVVAPISEELFYRGFLFTGFAASPLGGAGAVFLTALLWAMIHVQYNLYGMGLIFITGLFLGWARWQTNSAITTIVLHALMNLLATIQAAVQVALTRQP